MARNQKTARPNVADTDVIVFGDFNTKGQAMIDELWGRG